MYADLVVCYSMGQSFFVALCIYVRGKRQLYVYRVAKLSPKVCSRLTTKVADLVVPARFLIILFLMQFVLSFQSDIFIGCGQFAGKGVCCGLSIASVPDLSKSFSYIQKVRTVLSHLCMLS